jgi:hypothetical protein
MKQRFMLATELKGITCLKARPIACSSTLSSSTTILPGHCKKVITAPFNALPLKKKINLMQACLLHQLFIQL